MGLLRRTKQSFGNLQQALVNIVLAPFVALGAGLGVFLIGLSYVLAMFESFLAFGIGSQTLYEFGKKTIPDFYF